MAVDKKDGRLVLASSPQQRQQGTREGTQKQQPVTPVRLRDKEDRPMPKRKSFTSLKLSSMVKLPP